MIEYAKLIRRFTLLDQNEQILLLKKNSFDLVLLILSQFLNYNNGTLTTDSCIFPIYQLFAQWEECMEKKLAQDMLNCISDLASFKLTPDELPLLAVLVLFQKEKYAISTELHYVQHIQHCLSQHLSIRTGDETLIKNVLEFIPRFKSIGSYHMECLQLFRIQTMNEVKLPELYEELFSEQQNQL